MKVILVLMDTLRYDFMEMCPDPTMTPNFHKLAKHSVNYTKHYTGSLPCMPARRELHTGRYSFMHRGWGPLEPYDDSMPEILKQNGIHSRLVSDHYHYWDDGGATYHTRYSTWECVRGHESDKWKPCLDEVEIPELAINWNTAGIAQNCVNRRYMKEFKDSTLVRTFDLGMEFLDDWHDHDSWFLQIESFTPHEPFVCYEEFRKQFPDAKTGKAVEWGSLCGPDSPEATEDARNAYRALILECDNQIGRLIERMDRYHLWDDTMLILTSDHGTLLGEHGEWGKNMQPLFQEVVHTPFWVWDPRDSRAGITDDTLCRMIDLPATILDFFGFPIPEGMQGHPVREGGCEGALFGYYGSYVCCTDGKYVYMRAAQNPDNRPLYTYFLMPTDLGRRFPVDALRGSELVPGMASTKGVPVLRIPPMMIMPPKFMERYGTLLYDVETDPKEEQNLLATEEGAETEEAMKPFLARLMKEADAPEEQFLRLGLSAAEI